jgi:hypothetical protein
MTGAGTTPVSDSGSYPGTRLANCAGVLQPIVRFGVTGHRDLTDPAGASSMVIGAMGVVLRTLDAAIRPKGILHVVPPPATPIGYQIVSPLAEGADRVVASSVLTNDPGLSARPRELVVPLPFPLKFYRGSEGQPGSDCSDAASQAEFDRLRGAACWTRPLHAYDPSSQRQREAGYREVGKFVVAHSDVLFALWDGFDNGLEGGTAAIVDLALSRGVPVIWVPVTRQAEPDGEVPSDGITELRLLLGGEIAASHATVGRTERLKRAADSSLTLTSPLAALVLGGHRQAQQPLQELVVERLKRLQELQRSAVQRPAMQQSAVHRPAMSNDQRLATDHGLSPEPAADASSASRLLTATAQWIEAPYAQADNLAKRYQRQLRILTIGVYAAAATAVALGAFAAILFPYGGNWRLPVIFEALVLVTLLTVQWLDFRKICRDRWVAYREMTEYMRVGRYLALVTPHLSTGLDFNRVVRLSSWSSEPSLTPWFAPALERLWHRRPDIHLTDRDVTWLRDYIVTEWIDGQISYHEWRRETHWRWDRILKWAIRITLFATVLAVALHAVREYFPAFLGRTIGPRDLIAVVLAFLTIVLTSVAAAFNGYAGQQRHSYHHARFRRMAKELTSIRGLLLEATSIDQLRQNIGEVRRVTLGETTDWFEDMRDQLLDSPT